MKPKLQYLVESSTNEWYTPHHIVKSVKAVVHGVIDLDPYSCDAANAIVGATTYYTKESDAFLSDWPVVDSVFANPPYERKVIDRCVTQLIAYRRRWTATRFQMIVLVNAATEVSWFFALMTNCDAVCFVTKRIRFIESDGKTIGGSNTRGQALFYFGHDPERFGEIFSQHGYIFLNQN